MKTDLVNVVLGGMILRVPVIGDEETTHQIAGLVNARLAEIEEQSDRIDTHMFALQAALSIAGELEETRRNSTREIETLKRSWAKEIAQIAQERNLETREVYNALDRIADSLRALLKAARKTSSRND